MAARLAALEAEAHEKTRQPRRFDKNRRQSGRTGT
jgi:hypothetical protein